MVRGPGVPTGRTLDHLTGNIDLAPTWAELAGVEWPDFVDGRSLVPLLGDSPPPTTEWRQSFLLEHAPYDPPGGQAGAAAKATNTPEGVMEPPDPEDEYASGTPAALSSGKEALPYRGIRTADYVYVEYPTDEQELYDLRGDPYQLENLAATADPALRQELAARLQELAACAGASCRSIEDEPFVAGQVVARQADQASEALIYYLGYATQNNMEWIEGFDADVLGRGFLLFLNSNEAWLSDYRLRMEECQEDGRKFLVAIQAAVLVEDAADLPSLGAGDPALAVPMDPLPQWRAWACETPKGLTLQEAYGGSFAHSCLSNPAFQEFFEDRLRALIDSGADGVHIDELMTRSFPNHEGYCDDCMEGFRDFLAARYSAAELQARYGIEDINSFDFRDILAVEGNLETPPASPLHPEWWLFQLSDLSDVERHIISSTKSYAQVKGRQFLVTTNAYEPESNPAHIIEMTMTDFSSMGTGMTIRLRKGGKIVSTPRIPPDYSYIPLHRMAQGVTPNKAITLFIDGPGGTGIMKELPEQTQRDVVRWMFAEAYAAGARFHVPYPSLDYYAPLEECRQYVAFIQANRAAYEGADHLADVGLLFSYASQIWDSWVGASTMEPNHSLQWYGLAQALTDMSVQYGVVFAPDGNVIPDNLALDDLVQYDTIIVPWAYSLSDDQIELLEEYARSGNTLIVVGDLGTVDEEKNPRSTDAASSLRASGATVVPGLNFETYLNDPGAPEAAAVVDALNDLIPDRLVRTTNDSVTALLSRKGDTLYCHLINRQREDAGFNPQMDFEVQITLPSGIVTSDANASYMSPDLSGGAPTVLPTTRHDGSVQMTIPELEIYGVVTLSVR
ncbi:MAG TPA: hypothetical protein ENO24_05555, partial [Chloroflexi bacterium]|nr:hypothetical protein [Chloroflexota bacterium]